MAMILAIGGITHGLVFEGGLFWIAVEGAFFATVGGVTAVIVAQKESIPERIGIGGIVGFVVGVIVSSVGMAIAFADKKAMTPPIVYAFLGAFVVGVYGMVAGAITGGVVSLLNFRGRSSEQP